tara:strand:+ start:762 stop:1697 length:936 start_codon:yes stop_codon:yes gene_type:complete
VNFEPITLDDLAGQKHFVSDARSWEDKEEWPNAILLYGPPGTGKTSAARVIARSVLADFYDPINYVITNASDDRGIDFVRNDLKQWSSVKAVGAARRVIVLDEADGLTPAAQDAARQIIELNADNCLFILTANDVSKIRPAIKSRCACYEFKPITPKEGADRLMDIKFGQTMSRRNVNWKDAAMYLMHHTGGDMRQAVHKWVYTDSSEGILELKVEEESASAAALAAMGSQWLDMRSSLYKMLDGGHTLTQAMRSFHNNLTSFVEMDSDTTFTVMAVLGEMVPHMYEWPIGSHSFIDCLVARLKKEVESND